MATISDVAKLSGISVSTVSRVINDNPHVSPEKRQKVLEAMEQLGYAPMQAARQMRGSGSQNIAVVIPNITNTFFAYLVNAIERTCREHDYKTLIIQTYGEKKLEEEALNLLKLHHVDGVILCALENDPAFIQSYARYGSLVICNEYNSDEGISTIQCRQYEGFYEATEYLINKGYERIGYCAGTRTVVIQPVGVNINTDRYMGYAEALSAHNMVANPAFVYTRIKTFEDGQKFIEEYADLDVRPDAVIAGSDQVAAGMVFEARKRGIRIPEDLAIMGVDDQPIATQIEIPLTTIRQPVEEEGRLAAVELLRQLGGDKKKSVRKKLKLELAIRQTA